MGARETIVLACLTVVGCGGPNIGFGVAVTVHVANDVSDMQLASVTALVVSTTGNEIEKSTVALNRSLQRREELEYRPLASTRDLELTVTAVDANGDVVALGSSPPLTVSPGNTTFTDITLAPTTLLPDLAVVDASVPDLTSTDLTASTMPDLVSRHFVAQVSNTTETLLAMWGSGPTEIYAVGVPAPAGSGVVLKSTGGGVWAAYQVSSALGYGGNTWQSIWGTTCGAFMAESSSGPCVIVGGNASTCVRQPIAPALNLFGIWGSSCNDVYAVGGGGALYHETAGATALGNWTAETSGVTTPLFAVWGTSATNVYVVGRAGVVLGLSQGSWTMATSVPGSVDLWSMWGSAADDMYVVGGEGAIWHSDNGTVWTAQESGVTGTLHGVWGSSASDIYAVGDEGTLLHSTGKGDWTPLAFDGGDMGAAAPLSAVWGSSADDVYIVGHGGLILHGP